MHKNVYKEHVLKWAQRNESLTIEQVHLECVCECM